MPGSMTCTVFLCSILTVASLVKSQGYNGCKDSGWHYHDRTHTCFKFFKNWYSWNNSKRRCQAYWGATNYKSNGHLARIDDEETNTFVKGLLGTSREAWIGLRSEGEGIPFRWQGYPNEEPPFLKFSTTPRHRSAVSVAITTSYWKTLAGNNGQYFVCQVEAEIPEAVITCPPAVRQNNKLSQPVTCTFHFNQWKSIVWFRKTVALASCSKQTSSCHNRQNGYEASLQGRTAILNYNGVIGRNFDGRMECSIISTKNEVLATKTCDLQVYEPPSTIECKHELTRDYLHVICKTGKIFPEASCNWFYKSHDDTSYHTVSASEARNGTHEEFSDSIDNNKYFSSQCYVNLTRKGTEFKAGIMFVKVIMHPTVKGSDLSKIQDASDEYEQGVFIGLPKKPVITVNDEQVQDSVAISAGESVTVLCQVKSGQPTVQSTTLSCAFPFTSGGDSQNTWRGITYKVIKKADADMDGKNCSCWGNHITGSSEKSTVTFVVSYPATVRSFTANGRETQLTTDVASQIQLRCQSSGNPMPLVNILKYSNHEEKSLKSSKYQNVLETSFPAQCMDNSKYQCRAQNRVKNTNFDDSWDLDIHVRCLPMLRDGQNARPTIVARLGQEAEVNLRVVGYPEPSNTGFYLLKENNEASAEYPQTNYSVEHTLDSAQTVTGVKIQFNKIVKEDHGNFTLHYNSSGKLPSSQLRFQLSIRGPPDCPKNIAVLAVGHSSISLSWLPGSDNGISQTFVFSPYDNNMSSEIQTVKAIPDNGANEIMTYKFTGFPPETHFVMRLDAENQEGRVLCSGNLVNFTTGAAPKPLAGSGTIAAIVIIVIIIVIIVVGIAVFLFLRKRKRQTFQYKQASYSATGASNGVPDSYSSNNKVSVHVQRTAVKESESSMSEEFESEKHVYNNEEEDNSCNNFVENVYNNVGHIEKTEYANAAVHCNEDPESSSLPPTPTPAVVEFESRRNDDGLIYMDVVIDPIDQRPKIKSEQTSKAGLSADEAVEYTSIDFLATAEVNSSVDELDEEES